MGTSVRQRPPLELNVDALQRGIEFKAGFSIEPALDCLLIRRQLDEGPDLEGIDAAELRTSSSSLRTGLQLKSGRRAYPRAGRIVVRQISPNSLKADGTRFPIRMRINSAPNHAK